MKKKLSLLPILALTAVILFVCKASSYFVSTPTVSEPKSVTIPVIMYHSLLKDSARQNDFVISPDLFEQDLKYLLSHGYTTVTVADLIDYVYNGAPLPDKPVLLTFDDGYYNNYLYAYPLLQKYNMKAVISPIGCMTEKYSAVDENNAYYSHITYYMIREMTASGLVELQNHSYNLHKTGSTRQGAAQAIGESDEMYRRTLTEDLTKFSELIKQNAGVEATAFFYPYGAVSETAEEVLKQLGFKASFTCEEKKNTITQGDTSSLYKLGRYRRRNFQSSDYFFTNIVHLGG